MRATVVVLAFALAALGAAAPQSAIAAEDPASQPAAGSGAEESALPPEVIARLSPEQITSILRERELSRSKFPARPPDVLGAVLFFGTLLGMVLLSQIQATRRERLRQQTLLAMVEKGLEIPPGLVGRGASPASDLRRGLVLVGAGLGLSLLFAILRMNGQGAAGLWSVGLVPILMGAGYLIAWRVEARKNGGR